MQNTWRFINSGKCSSAENMALDEAVLTAHSEGKVPPTLRFYGWDPPTLSIGYFQRAEEEINFAEVERQGIGFVRRPTGGRAVLHDQELTYSMIVAESYPNMPGGVTEAYRVLSEGLLLGFRNLDLKAEMVNLSTDEDRNKYTAASSSACFDSPSWYELVVEGRKAAGSAQTRQKGVILQHGSILLELDIDLLFSLLLFPSERLRDRLRRDFSLKAVAINDVRRDLSLSPIQLPAVEAAFIKGIAEGLGVTLEEAELTPYEKDLAKQFVKDKYNTEEWNHRR